MYLYVYIYTDKVQPHRHLMKKKIEPLNNEMRVPHISLSLGNLPYLSRNSRHRATTAGSQYLDGFLSILAGFRSSRVFITASLRAPPNTGGSTGASKPSSG